MNLSSDKLNLSKMHGTDKYQTEKKKATLSQTQDMEY